MPGPGYSAPACSLPDIDHDYSARTSRRSSYELALRDHVSSTELVQQSGCSEALDALLADTSSQYANGAPTGRTIRLDTALSSTFPQTSDLIPAETACRDRSCFMEGSTTVTMTLLNRSVAMPSDTFHTVQNMHCATYWACLRPKYRHQLRKRRLPLLCLEEPSPLYHVDIYGNTDRRQSSSATTPNDVDVSRAAADGHVERIVRSDDVFCAMSEMTRGPDIGNFFAQRGACNSTRSPSGGWLERQTKLAGPNGLEESTESPASLPFSSRGDMPAEPCQPGLISGDHTFRRSALTEGIRQAYGVESCKSKYTLRACEQGHRCGFSVALSGNGLASIVSTSHCTSDRVRKLPLLNSAHRRSSAYDTATTTSDSIVQKIAISEREGGAPIPPHPANLHLMPFMQDIYRPPNGDDELAEGRAQCLLPYDERGRNTGKRNYRTQGGLTNLSCDAGEHNHQQIRQASTHLRLRTLDDEPTAKMAEAHEQQIHLNTRQQNAYIAQMFDFFRLTTHKYRRFLLLVREHENRRLEMEAFHKEVSHMFAGSTGLISGPGIFSLSDEMTDEMSAIGSQTAPSAPNRHARRERPGDSEEELGMTNAWGFVEDVVQSQLKLPDFDQHMGYLTADYCNDDVPTMLSRVACMLRDHNNLSEVFNGYPPAELHITQRLRSSALETGADTPFESEYRLGTARILEYLAYVAQPRKNNSDCQRWLDPIVEDESDSNTEGILTEVSQLLQGAPEFMDRCNACLYDTGLKLARPVYKRRDLSCTIVPHLPQAAYSSRKVLARELGE
jgi:hypothetical protein